MEQVELYQNHGDHIEAIMPTNVFISHYLRDILQKSKINDSVRTETSTENMDNEITDVYSLSYGEGSMSMLALLAKNSTSNTNDFVSIYPMLQNGDNSLKNGNVHLVKIDNVVEWDSHLEATIYVSTEDFSFAFFATDYYKNKNLYKVGKEIIINLSALGMKVELAEKGFTFEGQQAIDWLSKIGEKPQYDENGNVEPVHFSTEKLVAFLAHDEKCPDEGEFQSPSLWEQNTSLLGINFVRVSISIHQTDNGKEFKIPLYFRKDMLPENSTNEPLRGWLWLTGSIAINAFAEYIMMFKAKDTLAKMASGIKDYIDRYMDLDFDPYFRMIEGRTSNLNALLTRLPLLKIDYGYVLDTYTSGDTIGSCIIPYCRKADEDPALINNHQRIPNTLDKFTVPFNELGIMQAWFIENLTTFLPKFWHGLYDDRFFVFSDEDINSIRNNDEIPEDIREKILFINKDDLFPKVKILRNAALMSYSYWTMWGGLLTDYVVVEKNGHSVLFSEPEHSTLIDYNCGICF